MQLALVLFTIFYTPKPVVTFTMPIQAIEQPMLQAPVRLPQTSQLRQVPQKVAEPVNTTPQEFYQYTCPEGQYPIGDGQCHINNDMPNGVVK